MKRNTFEIYFVNIFCEHKLTQNVPLRQVTFCIEKCIQNDLRLTCHETIFILAAVLSGFMNKASRKSGGRAWMEPSVGLSELLRLLNLLKHFLHRHRFTNLIRPGYDEYLTYLGYTDGIPNNDQAIRIIDEFCKSSFLDERFIVFRMRWLEKVLRLMPGSLALDILRHSPHTNPAETEKRMALLKAPGARIFENEHDEDLRADFSHFISRFTELFFVADFLSDLLQSWDKYQPEAESLFRSDEFKTMHFQLLRISKEFESYVRVGVDKEFKIVFYLNESFRILDGADITRIRTCPECNNFFWAGRKDAVGCSLCAAKLRKKRWRSNNAKRKNRKF